MSSAERPVPRWPLSLFRAAASVLGGLGLVQTMLAGSFLNGHFESFHAHEVTARAVLAGAVVQLVAAALLHRVGRGPGWPVGLSAALLGAVLAQIAAGYGRAVGVHVTLGVLLFGGILLGLVGAWRERPPAVPVGGSDEGSADGRLPRPAGPVEVAK
ncbi:hypothetical protein ACWEQL_05260 [Kitasatospora sp. NPDC004240]